MNNLVKNFLSLVLVLLALIATAKVFAIGEIYDFSSTELLERYEELTKELRCPKCQNQNLSDSVSEISDDLRREIHLMLEQGQTDQQIKDFLVARYGTFVLYNPPAAGSTLWVWLVPVFFALAGSFLVWRVLLQAKQRPIIAEGDEEDLL
ncbi:MAG: cytochrome c-type biogenesis protein CcmH [Porticoccaceae bacterium]|jgi:cytochrome c-type biogenesis protein CcmH|nr:cytochrome c-type biogenesis protein CcmH [Porticoccaceae bacterium]